MHSIRIAAQQRLDHDVALGHPRPLVEQLRGLEKRREVDRHALAAKLLQLRRCGLEQACVVVVAKELQLIGLRYAEAERPVLRSRRAAASAGRSGANMGRRASASPSWHAGTTSAARPPCVEGQQRDGVERSAGRQHAARAEPAAGRLQPDQVVERGWRADGSGGVGAKREAHPGRQRASPRSRARAAADVLRIEAVAADAVGRAGAGQTGGELDQGWSWADRNRARVDQGD